MIEIEMFVTVAGRCYSCKILDTKYYTYCYSIKIHKAQLIRPSCKMRRLICILMCNCLPWATRLNMSLNIF